MSTIYAENGQELKEYTGDDEVRPAPITDRPRPLPQAIRNPTPEDDARHGRPPQVIGDPTPEEDALYAAPPQAIGDPSFGDDEHVGEKAVVPPTSP